MTRNLPARSRELSNGSKVASPQTDSRRVTETPLAFPVLKAVMYCMSASNVPT